MKNYKSPKYFLVRMTNHETGEVHEFEYYGKNPTRNINNRDYGKCEIEILSIYNHKQMIEQCEIKIAEEKTRCKKANSNCSRTYHINNMRFYLDRIAFCITKKDLDWEVQQNDQINKATKA